MIGTVARPHTYHSVGLIEYLIGVGGATSSGWGALADDAIADQWQDEGKFIGHLHVN